MSANARSPSLHGLRGVLAFIVLINHVADFLPHFAGRVWLLNAANLSVATFFVLSGYVLTASYKGDLAAFLVKRFIRLWPVFAICLGLGYLVNWTAPNWTQFFWWPVLRPNSVPRIDPPIWSLCIEACAMPFMGVIAWAGRGAVWRVLVGVILVGALSNLENRFLLGLFFLAGAFLSRFSIHIPGLDRAAPQFLGRISYSLYLVNYPLLTLAAYWFGPAGAVLSVPAIVFAGWALCVVIDEPAMRLSRRAEKMFQQRITNPAWRWIAAPAPSLPQRPGKV